MSQDFPNFSNFYNTQQNIYKLSNNKGGKGWFCNYTDDLLKPLSLDPNQFHIWKIRCGISHLFSTNLQTLCILYKRSLLSCAMFVEL